MTLSNRNRLIWTMDRLIIQIAFFGAKVATAENSVNIDVFNIVVVKGNLSYSKCLHCSSSFMPSTNHTFSVHFSYRQNTKFVDRFFFSWLKMKLLWIQFFWRLILIVKMNEKRKKLQKLFSTITQIVPSRFSDDRIKVLMHEKRSASNRPFVFKDTPPKCKSTRPIELKYDNVCIFIKVQLSIMFVLALDLCRSFAFSILSRVFFLILFFSSIFSSEHMILHVYE